MSDMERPTEQIKVETTTVGCDGGPLGHPHVYLKLAADGEIVCPYCSRHYVLVKKPPESATG
ncbi:MAG: zinc-finger domain-containing protein [Rhodospirillales bacterium]|nr:zinc-finger domain-containing protein [Rhodospirillales bacterium]